MNGRTAAWAFWLLTVAYLGLSMGVPASTVISAFVFERALDLIVALVIAMLAAWHWEVFPVVMGFVFLALTGVVVLDKNPLLLDRLSEYFAVCAICACPT